MLKAIVLANECIKSGKGGPFGAVIIKDGKIVGKGSNLVTSDLDPTAHAEIVAIRDACNNLKTFQLENCEIYSSCEPCPMCLGAIYWARPKALYFASSRFDAAHAGFDDNFIYQEIDKTFENRKINTFHIPNSLADDVFEKWKNWNCKIEY